MILNIVAVILALVKFGQSDVNTEIARFHQVSSDIYSEIDNLVSTIAATNVG